MNATCLDIDIGNTRTKWRFGDQRGALPTPELPTPALLAPALPGLDRDAPSRVRISSVRGDRRRIDAAVTERFGVSAEFAATAKSAYGLTCAYEDPSQLGVDRWLAMLAAWCAHRRPLLVCDAGTAITLDWVDGRGFHLGGYIAPGFALMRRALRQETRDVRPSEFVDERCTEHPLTPGVNTGQAVDAGTLAMAVGMVEAALRRVPEATLVLTGGDANILCAGLAATNDPQGNSPRGIEIERVADLVLDGLALALP